MVDSIYAPPHINGLPFDFQYNGHYREVARKLTAERYIFEAICLPLVLKESNWDEKSVLPKQALYLVLLLPATAQSFKFNKFDLLENLYTERDTQGYNKRFVSRYLFFAAHNTGPKPVQHYISILLIQKHIPVSDQYLKYNKNVFLAFY